MIFHFYTILFSFHAHRQLFEKFNVHKTLLERQIALDAKENEPGRLNNRGGQLLKEEKERRTIQTKLPKIDSEICRMAEQFEHENNRKFLVWGEDILSVIENDSNARKTLKKESVSARKAIKDGTNNLLRTPMSAAKQIRPQAQTSIKRMASSTCLYFLSLYFLLH